MKQQTTPFKVLILIPRSFPNLQETHLIHTGTSPFLKIAIRESRDPCSPIYQVTIACLLSLCSFPEYKIISSLADKEKVTGCHLTEKNPHYFRCVLFHPVGTAVGKPDTLSPRFLWPLSLVGLEVCSCQIHLQNCYEALFPLLLCPPARPCPWMSHWP